MTTLKLTVTNVAEETALIRRVQLALPDGSALPGFDAGAHVTLQIPGVGPRKYSLVNAAAEPAANANPSQYVLAVRLETGGGGGSVFVHALRTGDRIDVGPPENNFRLTSGTAPVLLIAGGIGVTPLISMAASMKASGRPFRFIYAARSRTDLAFMPEITGLAGAALEIHADDEKGAVLDVKTILGGLKADEAVYICGPKPMLKAGITAARALGWPAGRLKFELFYSAAALPAAAPASGSFEVELKSSGKIFNVPQDKSILEVLIAAGEDPLHDCGRGECGVCQTGVVAGVPDHRDSILSAGERDAGKVMQICVSRAKSARLVLDL